MFLRTGITNRRKFLERTALGTGSVLFLPGLLASCTDHRIPDPGTPVSVGAENIDWNDDAKIAVTAGLRLIPEVGGILSALASIFWPNTQVDVWDQVKDRVEALVNQKISDFVIQQVKEDLQGLNNSVILYLNELKNGNPASILGQWLVTRNSFATALPHFQSNEYKMPLLGLFAQFANMYLALLRDGVSKGKSWGRSDADQQQDVKDLQKSISDFYNYTLDTHNAYYNTLVQNTPRNDTYNQPFTTLNSYSREVTFAVLDFMNTWAYYDITKYPTGATVPLAREVYSNPQGSCVLSGPINLVNPVPTQGPTQLTVWAYDRIDAVQLTYPAGSGPGGVTTTPRMGDQPVGSSGGTSNPPYGGKFDISPTNPIVSASTKVAGSLIAVIFQFKDGSYTNRMGGHQYSSSPQDLGSDPNWVSVPDHLISRIHINGVGHAGSADCVVYGFKYLNGGPSVSLRTLGALYIKSPKEQSAADFAQAFPAYGIADSLITDELKAARQAYWASVKARAEALK